MVAVVMRPPLVGRAVQRAAHARCPAGPADQSTPSALATSTALLLCHHRLRGLDRVVVAEPAPGVHMFRAPQFNGCLARKVQSMLGL